jgi:hypothetical protein
MRTLLRTLGLASITVTLAAASLVGCAAPAEEDVGGTEGAAVAASSDPRAAMLAQTKAMSRSAAGVQTIIAAPAKTEAVGKLLGGAMKESRVGERCMPTWTMSLLDAKEESVGTLSSYGCANKAYLTASGKTYELTVKTAEIDAVFAEPLVVGDYVWGIDEFAGSEGVSTKEPNGIATWLGAFSMSEQPKLEPAAEVTEEKIGAYSFRRNGKEAATVTIFMPKDDKALAAPAKLSAAGKDIGWATFDLGKVFKPF